MKNKKGETQKFDRNKKLACVAIVIVTSLILTSFLLLYSSHPSLPKAAIIDQLGSLQLSDISRHENETFIDIAKELLYERFSKVDYYSDNATVGHYKLLPSQGYKLIIWRAHSALDLNFNYIAVSTSEKYIAKKYDQYLDSGQLTLCNITGDPNLYFGITPKFIKESMSGRFEDTVIILMSCNGLKQGYFKTADAFIEKGVKAFISWNGWINPSDNDHAITLFLQHLINNDTIGEAKHKIPIFYSDWGPSELKYYPDNVADYRIPNYKEDDKINNVGFMVVTHLRKNFRRLSHYAGSSKVLIALKQWHIIDYEAQRLLD